jgi:hypothetical protein
MWRSNRVAAACDRIKWLDWTFKDLTCSWPTLHPLVDPCRSSTSYGEAIKVLIACGARWMPWLNLPSFGASLQRQHYHWASGVHHSAASMAYIPWMHHIIVHRKFLKRTIKVDSTLWSSDGDTYSGQWLSIAKMRYISRMLFSATNEGVRAQYRFQCSCLGIWHNDRDLPFGGREPIEGICQLLALLRSIRT